MKKSKMTFFAILQVFWALAAIYCIVLIILNGSPFVVANNKAELCSLAASIIFLISGAIYYRLQTKRSFATHEKLTNTIKT